MGCLGLGKLVKRYWEPEHTDVEDEEKKRHHTKWQCL